MCEFNRRQLRNQNRHKYGSTVNNRTMLPLSLPENAVPTQNQYLGNQATLWFAHLCPLSLPSVSMCPFGGVCNACPQRAQAKQKINRPGDKFEQEADRVSEEVMSMPEPANAEQSSSIGAFNISGIQRQCSECEEELQRQPEEGEEEKLVRAKKTAGQSFNLNSSIERNINFVHGGGQPLAKSVRNYFENRLGFDFGHVSIHTDSSAKEKARSLNARAFTKGKDIIFNEGEYSPDTRTGKKLLAHELVHVMQQTRKSSIGIQRAPSFEDCSAGQQTTIQNAIRRAQGWVSTALRELRAALSGTISAHLGTVLSANFHTRSAADIRRIISGFNKINTALGDSITYECESWCMGEKCGYVYNLWTDVHFCPSYFSSRNPVFQARCLVHELAHKEAGAGGDTYVYDPGYATLTPAEAINNADSYAIFARNI